MSEVPLCLQLVVSSPWAPGGYRTHGARPVHLIITMIKWIRTSRLSIKNSLSPQLVVSSPWTPGGYRTQSDPSSAQLPPNSAQPVVKKNEHREELVRKKNEHREDPDRLVTNVEKRAAEAPPQAAFDFLRRTSSTESVGFAARESSGGVAAQPVEWRAGVGGSNPYQLLPVSRPSTTGAFRSGAPSEASSKVTLNNLLHLLHCSFLICYSQA